MHTHDEYDASRKAARQLGFYARRWKEVMVPHDGVLEQLSPYRRCIALCSEERRAHSKTLLPICLARKGEKDVGPAFFIFVLR